MELRGRIIEGKGIASGKNVDPETGLTNTIALQKPFFERAGVTGITEIFPGTVNMDISPRKFQILEPDYTVENITWELKKEATESFQFVKTDILFEEKKYSGLIYYPMPSELKSHPDTRIELLAPKIPHLNYGKEISIYVPDGKILIH